MKKLLILTVLVFLISIGPVHAGALRLSDSISVLDNIGYAVNLHGDQKGSGGAAGIYIGTIAGVYNGDLKLLGLGGFSIQGTSRVGDSNQGESVAFAASFVPVSFFNDMIQPGIGFNFQDGTKIYMLSLSITQALKLSGVTK